MPLLNFKAEFAALVESGQKRQTIRRRRKDGRDPKPGDKLYLYTGCRTKKARKLGEVRCRSVDPIRITDDRGGELWSGTRRFLIADAYAIARSDGFGSLMNLIGWFDRVHGLPFEGLLIRW